MLRHTRVLKNAFKGILRLERAYRGKAQKRVGGLERKNATHTIV